MNSRFRVANGREKLVRMETSSVDRPAPAVVIAALESARREQAQQFRAVLDRTRFGAPDSALSKEGLAAAEGLLDLGFPHAFELTPRELAALRAGERIGGSVFSLLATLGTMGVVGWGMVNVFLSLIAFDYGMRSCGIVLLFFSSLSATVAFGAGYDVLRLTAPASIQRTAARRLLNWSLAALGVHLSDLGMAQLMTDPNHFWCHHGWGDVGWILPVILPLALFIRRGRIVRSP